MRGVDEYVILLPGKRESAPMNLLDIIVIVAYFVGMAVFGVYFATKNKTTEDYFLGGRSFPGWAIGISLIGTAISSLSFLGTPADTFKTAWLRTLYWGGFPFAVLLGAYFFMPFFRRTKATSAFEYLEARFGPGTRVYGAVSFVLAQIVRVAMILYLLSLVGHELTGLPIWLCVVASGVFVSFYTVAGGIEAVVWTDVVQTIVLAFGGVICLVAVVRELPGGFGEIFRVASAAGKFGFSDLGTDGALHPAGWRFSFSDKTALMVLFVGIFHFVAEYACNQNVVQRYCATASARETRKALAVNCAGSMITWIFFAFLGTSLFVFYQHFPADEAAAMLAGETKAEQILPFFIIHQLPAGISGLVLAAVVAAAMSSLDSSLNAIATVSVVDIYRRHIAPDRDDAHHLLAARAIAMVASVLMILGAIILAYSETTTIADTGVAAMSILAGGLLGLYLLGFLTTRGDGRAVAVAIFCTILWSLYMTLDSYKLLPEGLSPPVDSYYVGIIGHVVMFVVGYAGALLVTPKRNLTNLTIWTQDGTPLE